MNIQGLQNQMKLDFEKSYLLIVLGDYLNKRDSIKPKKIDWNKMYELSTAHLVESIIFLQCKQFMPKEVYSKFRVRDLQNKSRFNDSLNQLNEISTLFSKNGIEHVLLKGMDIAKYYPDPYVRYTCDIDILVDKKKQPFVNELMVSKGYKLSGVYSEHVYTKENMTFEIHYVLASHPAFTNADEICLFNNFQNYTYEDSNTEMMHLEKNFLFAYMIHHLKKHFLASMITFRMYLDLCIFYKYSGVDDKSVNKLLNNTELQDFTLKVFKLCNVWFDCAFKYPADNKIELTEMSVESITNRMFANSGSNIDADVNWDFILASKSDGKHSKLAIIRMKLFPSYDVIMLNPHYSFVENKKYLLPFAWIYRFYRGVRYEHILRPSTISTKINSVSEKIDEANDWEL